MDSVLVTSAPATAAFTRVCCLAPRTGLHGMCSTPLSPTMLIRLQDLRSPRATSRSSSSGAAGAGPPIGAAAGEGEHAAGRCGGGAASPPNRWNTSRLRRSIAGVSRAGNLPPPPGCAGQAACSAGRQPAVRALTAVRSSTRRPEAPGDRPRAASANPDADRRTEELEGADATQDTLPDVLHRAGATQRSMAPCWVGLDDR